jgi:hypothetical protein
MKKESTYVENSAGGLDLMVERDAGNEVRILTGKGENSLAFWTQLKELCEGAIFALEDVKTLKQRNMCVDGCTYSRSMDQPYPRKCVYCSEPEKV